MFTGQVEADTGDILRIQHENGRLGGNLVYSFLSGVEDYCLAKPNTSIVADHTWFEALEQKLGPYLCEDIRKLFGTVYSGEWNYQTDQYKIYQLLNPRSVLTEHDFIKTVEHVRNMWTDIEWVIDTVERIIDLLRNNEVKESIWFVGEESIHDFQALHSALSLLEDRYAERVRINIS
ncbi:MAG: hypothetical protein L0154_16885 [Chloroflexi bacterium]|nr:hypothetical protein [Chloroflexota bacterium]